MDVKFTQSTDGGAHLVDAGRRQRQRRPAGRADRPVPAVGRGRPERRGRRRVLRPARRPARTTRASCPPTSGGRTSASTPRCRRTRTAAAAPCRSAANVRISQFTLGSGAAGTAPRRPLAVPMRRRHGIHARRAAGSSATTSGSRSPAATSTRSMVSTHYPSNVTADEGGPIYYQQQVLATVPRAGIGAGY